MMREGAGGAEVVVRGALAELGLTSPVLAAPMAGGPTVPALVAAARRAGSLGFLAAGYKPVEVIAEQVAAAQAAGEVFGVNLFAPNPLPVDPGEFRRYAELIQPEAEAYGIDLRTAEPVEDDDGWGAKVDLLLADPVPVVSFTFGVPARTVITALRRAGSLTVQTVTTVDEAGLAEEAGVDVLAVQAAAAGGHSATLSPRAPIAEVPLPTLLAAVHERTRLPLIGAGGIGTAGDVAAALHAGADAVMVGTALLRSDESAASDVYKAAIAAGGDTVLTRAFTGRPARGLRNRFIDRYDAAAPYGYPAIHHLTSAVRRAAAAAGNPDPVNLWSGTGHRGATADPAGTILTRLAATS
jgi:nitronate monooxygenase